MRNYITFYYLLTVLLIMGAFAAMAQNSYGLTILGLVCYGFALIFLLQFVSGIRQKQVQPPGELMDLPALFIISVILALRLFHLHFPFIEWIFALAGLALILVYIQKMVGTYRQLGPKNQWAAAHILVFQGSILFFTLSLVTVLRFLPLSRFAGGLALILLVAGLLGLLLRSHYLVEGQNLAVFNLIGAFRDRSVLLLALFLLSSLYLNLTGTGILPRIYSDEYPQAYFELVNLAETGKEKPVDGTYQYERFRKMYEQFLEKDINSGGQAPAAP